MILRTYLPPLYYFFNPVENEDFAEKQDLNKFYSLKEHTFELQYRIKKGNPWNLQNGSYCKVIVTAKIGEEIYDVVTKIQQGTKVIVIENFITNQEIQAMADVKEGQDSGELSDHPYLTYVDGFYETVVNILPDLNQE